MLALNWLRNSTTQEMAQNQSTMMVQSICIICSACGTALWAFLILERHSTTRPNTLEAAECSKCYFKKRPQTHLTACKVCSYDRTTFAVPSCTACSLCEFPLRHMRRTRLFPSHCKYEKVKYYARKIFIIIYLSSSSYSLPCGHKHAWALHSLCRL